MREWCGFEGLCLKMIEEPDFVAEMASFWADFVAATMQDQGKTTVSLGLMTARTMAAVATGCRDGRSKPNASSSTMVPIDSTITPMMTTATQVAMGAVWYSEITCQRGLKPWSPIREARLHAVSALKRPVPDVLTPRSGSGDDTRRSDGGGVRPSRTPGSWRR